MADADEEDSWLYGNPDEAKVKTEASSDETKINEDDSEKMEVTENGSGQEQNQLPPVVNGETKNTGQAEPADVQSSDAAADSSEATKAAETSNAPSTNDKSAANEDESDSDEDDVQVTIGAITTGTEGGGIFPMTGPASRSFYRSPVQVIGTPKATVNKGVDLAAPGNINGQAVIDFNLDSLEDKPWRKPGADISDYFNFGFNELTWKIYCEKQKRLRSGMDAPSLPQSSSISARTSSVLSSILAKYENKHKIVGTPNRVGNTVQSISTLQFTRRKDNEAVSGANTTSTVVTSTTVVPSAAPPTSAPLYTIPPRVNGPAIPIQFDPTKPPPPLGLPPPGFPAGAALLPPAIRPPGTEFIQLPPVSGAPLFPPPGSYLLPPGSQLQQQSIYIPDDGEESHNQSDNLRSEDDGRYRDHRSSSSRREYDRERDRDRERHSRRSDYRDDYRERSRDRDRDRGRDRDRERDRDRDRDRDRRRRDESPPRHKSTRRKYEDDERYSSSSKHKKAKKHKDKQKDRDESTADEEPLLTEDQIKKEPIAT